jgi:hypothetical protein
MSIETGIRPHPQPRSGWNTCGVLLNGQLFSPKVIVFSIDIYSLREILERNCFYRNSIFLTPHPTGHETAFDEVNSPSKKELTPKSER